MVVDVFGVAVVDVVDATDGCAPDVTLPLDDPHAVRASTAVSPSALVIIFVCVFIGIATNRLRPIR
jgi:hypothetical protein